MSAPGAPAEGQGPSWLYLHGFASSPGSFTGRVLADHDASRGVALARLDLRLPSFQHLRLVRDARGGERDRAVTLDRASAG